jgi:GAF domain-containing protein
MAIARVKGNEDEERRGHAVLRESGLNGFQGPGELLDEQGALAAITEQLARLRLDPDEILNAVTSTLSSLRSGTWFAALINKDPRTVTIVVASDFDPKFARFVLDMPTSDKPATSPLWTSIFENGETFLNPDMPFDEFVWGLTAEVRDYFVNRQPAVAPQHRLGLLVAPMRARGAVVGALGLCEPPGSNPLSEDDVGWVQPIADRTGCAAESAQLHLDAAHRLERLAALRSVGLAISGSPDLRLTLQVILDQTVAGLGVDAAGILLVDKSDGLLQWAATRGFRFASVPDYQLHVDEVKPSLEVVARPTEAAIPRALTQFRRRSLFAREGFRDYWALPLVARGKLVGVFEIFHRSRLQPDPEDLEFFAALASEAAIAIDYAEMFGRHQNAGADHTRNPHDLGKVDMEILNHVAQGLTNRVIAGKVHLSEHTIKFRVRKMLVKLGVSNRTELAGKATQEGWLSQSTG